MSVALELARALGGIALAPARAAGYLLAHDALQRAVADDLRHPASVAPDPPPRAFPPRPLAVFVSCAEASGELHASRFVRELRAELAAAGAPAPELTGLGGERLAREGVALAGDPVARAAMGLDGVVSALPFYLRLLADAARALRGDRVHALDGAARASSAGGAPAARESSGGASRGSAGGATRGDRVDDDLRESSGPDLPRGDGAPRRPDLCVLVDSPALHVPLARIAGRAGVPVVHFVTPQYWGWAPWRVRGYRAAVDRALTILPFEPPWFERHGVATAHVGHPLLDALDGVPRIAPEPDGAVLALLPGSRASVVDRNLPWMLAVCRRLAEREPALVPRIVHGLAELRPRLEGHVRAAGMEGAVELRVGDLHAGLEGARAALSVSGTVLLDLLHQRLPTVVVYKLGRRREVWMKRHLLTAPWFASVNLLAAEEVCPERCFAGEGPVDEVAELCARALGDDAFRARCRAGLERAAVRLGPPGAVRRAVRQALAVCLPARGESPAPQLAIRPSTSERAGA